MPQNPPGNGPPSAPHADPVGPPPADRAGLPVVDPRGREPLAIGEEFRPDAAVVRHAQGGWIVLGHPEAVAVAEDPEGFSSAASAHLQVPNGLDGAEHAAFRAATDPFFAPARMAELEPTLQQIARELCTELAQSADHGVDAVADIGAVFAVRAQTAWLGWPRALEGRLLEWMQENHAASRSGDRLRTGAVAADFDAIIRGIISPRIADPASAPTDVTGQLLATEVRLPGEDSPRPLEHAEIVSILRNWTAGDLGSIALCVGVILHALSHDLELAETIRTGADRARVAAIIDELLRRDDPFVSNRRVATCPARLGGAVIAAGDRVVIQWTAANRDGRVFADPDTVDPAGHAAHNLVYGTGPHVCPGRPLATLELCVITEEVVRAFVIEPDDGTAAGSVATEREITPVGGFASVGLRLHPRR